MKTHICVSVRGMLHWSERETKKNLSFITKDDGSQFSCVVEFRSYLMDELAQGHEKLPMTPECDNFDFKRGCLGHEMEAEGEKITK